MTAVVINPTKFISRISLYLYFIFLYLSLGAIGRFLGVTVYTTMEIPRHHGHLPSAPRPTLVAPSWSTSPRRSTSAPGGPTAWRWRTSRSTAVGWCCAACGRMPLRCQGGPWDGRWM